MQSNRSMPASTVIPVLAYPDVAEAVAWLRGAFGFTLRLGIGDHRAQLNAGDGAIVVTDGAPADAPRGRDSVMIRVEDARAHHDPRRSRRRAHPLRARRLPLRRTPVHRRRSRRPRVDLLRVDCRRRSARLGRRAG
jgi:hypothetical protein